MKCNEAQLNILREHAGELVPWRRSTLHRHMAACAACRNYRTDLLQLAEAAHTAEQPPVDHFAMRMLLEAGQRTLDRRAVRSLGKRVGDFFKTWENTLTLRPALAVATAVLLLAIGVWLVRPHAGGNMAWNDGVDQQIEKLEASLASLEADSSRASSADAESIASQLLNVEG